MRRPRALANCTENLVISEKIQIEDIEQFIPAFTGIPENFCSICPQLSVPDYFREVKAIMPKMVDLFCFGILNFRKIIRV